MKKFCLLLTLAALAGCAMAPVGNDGTTLTAARNGEQVTLTLRNESGAPVGYNLCSSTLERRSGATWENVPTDEMCTRELRQLENGGMATFEKTLPGGLASGEYRYSTALYRDSENAQAASNPFNVP
jgi:hypothetical protein